MMQAYFPSKTSLKGFYLSTIPIDSILHNSLYQGSTFMLPYMGPRGTDHFGKLLVIAINTQTI
jgi:hypothetical protein